MALYTQEQIDKANQTNLEEFLAKRRTSQKNWK